MNGNCQNNYSGGWNDVPFNGFNQGQFNYNCHQTPTQYADNMNLPHQTPAHYVDYKQLPHQMSTQYIDNMQLPHQMPMTYVDNRKIPHQTPMQNVDNRQLPHQMPMQNVDNKQLPHQMQMQNFDNSQLLHQMPSHMQIQYVDNRQLQHQAPMQNVDNRQLPHQMVMQNFDNSHLLHQTPTQMQYVDNRQLPYQTPMQNFDNTQLLHQTPAQHVDNRPLPPHQMPAQHIDKRPLPPHQMPVQHVDNRPLPPHQMPEQHVDNRQVPHQMPTQHVDNSQLPHHMPMQNFDNTLLLHQTPAQMQYFVNMQLSPQMPTQHVDNRPLPPHQMPEQHVDNRSLPPHQMSAQHIDNRPLPPHQMPEQRVDNRQVPHQMPTQHVDNSQLPHHMPMQNFDNRQLLHQTPAQMQYVDNMQLSPQMPTQHVDNRPLPPHQMLAQHVDHVDNMPLPPHQMPTQHIDSRPLPPHQMPEQHVDNWQVPHQMPTQHVDNSPLPHHMPMQNFDNRQLLHQTPAQMQYVDNMQLSPQMPTQHVDNRPLPPHQMLAQHVDNRPLPPHQMPAQHIDSRPLPPHQMPEQHVDNRQVPHQMPTQHVDNKQLPHQMRAHFAVNRDLPQQTPEDRADKKCLPPLVHCDICDITMIPKCLKEHDNGRRHQRLLLELRQMPEGSADKKCLPQQMPNVTANKKPLPHENRECYDDGLCLTPLPPLAHCEICDITMIPMCLEQHYNGKKHKKVLLELRKQSTTHKTSNEEESRHIQDSQINPVVQPRKVPKFTRNHIRAMVSKGKKFLAERSKRKVRDNMNAKDRGFKRKIGGPTGSKYMKMNNGKRRRVKSSNPEVNALSNSVESLVELPELTPSSGCVASLKTAPIPAEETSFELRSQHVSASLSQESKGKEHHKFQNTVEKIDQPQSTPVELSASTGSNKIEFMSNDFAAIAPLQVPATSQVFTPPAVGSSFKPKNHIDSEREVTEAKEHREIQNRALERSDQPDTISMEFNAPTGSDINTLMEDSCSDSGAIVIALPQSPIASQVSTPVAVHNEIQNHIVDSNDQQHLVSMELQDPAGSITNNQTEVLNSDSTAIEVVIQPLTSAPPDASRSCFEAPTEHGLPTEIEPEVSESVAYFDSQHPTEETNIELLPSLSMEIDALSEVSAETETEMEDGSSQVEVDVVATESETTKLPQVSVCLTCGDEGFEEAIVYCNKCQDCARHRYCLDGPVVFTDEVIWFCEDCEQEVVDVDYPDEDTTNSEKGEVDSIIEDCVTVVDPQPIADPIWRGSLQVFHKSDDKTTSLMGHLSTLACLKVIEETRHLPNVLNADLLQRSAVWPASFAKFGTNNQSIGLYFFPQNERFERYYDQLVDEMISRDLAIRARVEKAELLIFPSTMLPSQYKRFQSKYYLWGVFKRKQAASTIKDS
ncbi:unnamed protein product [Trifolium pratense]|uniref:Uncharacterized protein n=1 Tax=Trifolium pratense TaxID=57577 RepID=A0ACB0LCA9_TRIPR|nr:unnamed protein product [Trifolium pratense]